MFSPFIVFSAVCIYVVFLFIIALWVERSSGLGKKLSDNSWVYALSLGVYCTAWTYYGSVGKAATSGMLFLTIYLGPTMSIIFWWLILRKLVRIKNTHHITSIADFISARYNKSQGLAVIATLVAFIGILPYIALQLKAIFSTFQIITNTVNLGASYSIDLVIVAMMILFTILLGARRLDPTERHPGMMIVLAVQCIVKLLAFLAVGIFVTYFLYHGFNDIFANINKSTLVTLINVKNQWNVPYVTWATYLLLAMSAIMFLPRQFHVAVVENSSEKHIRTAMWFFPLYMFLLNIFVYPIAMGGLLKGYSVQAADSFVLKLPLEQGSLWLGLFVFLGGLSAAMGMIMVASVTISTMIVNHWILPLIGGFRPLNFLRKNLLQCRWMAVAVIISSGWWFAQTIGASYTLVNIGMISFAAVAQFAPVIIGGLFWRRANKKGALLALSAGFLMWFYTILLPSFVRSSWLPESLIKDGPFGIGFLKPEHLFGINVLDPLSHGVFWSLAVNISIYILGSIYFAQEEEETKIAEDFVGILSLGAEIASGKQQKSEVDLSVKSKIILELLCQYFPEKDAVTMVEKCIHESGIKDKNKISLIELAELNTRLEKILAGATGSAAAHKALKQAEIFSLKEAGELQETYAEIIAGLKLNPEELKDKIDYYQEREKLITKHADELEVKIGELEDNIKERKKAEGALRLISNELERRVEERTIDLVKANEALRVENFERQRTEQALGESEERYRIIVEQTSHIVYDYDIPSGKIKWSGLIAQITGFTNEEFQKIDINGWTELIHPLDRQNVLAKLDRIMKEAGSYTDDYRFRKKDGAYIYIEDNGIFVKDKNGTVFRMLGVLKDVSARKIAEEEHQHNYDTQSAINQILSFSLTDISIEDLLVHVLSLLISIKWLAFESRGAIFLVEAPGALTMKAQSGLSEAARQQCKEIEFGHCICGRAALSKRIEFVPCVDERHGCRSEAVVGHGHYCVPIIFADTVLGIINMYVRENHAFNEKEEAFLYTVAYVLSGIIMRKRAQEELKGAYEKLKQAQSQLLQSSKMAAVGQLASGVAHEINNPLTGVLNNVQLIKMEMDAKEEAKASDFKELLNVVEESALRCKNIVRSLLDFSRASGGLFQIISLNELIEKVVALIGYEMRLQNITIAIQLQPDLPQVTGDLQLIQQVIFNLISNAKWAIQKKSQKEGGSILIVSAYDAKKKQIQLNITDTGIGISKEHLEHIFEPFFTTKPVGEGTGLGLSFVYNIVRQHNGTVEVKSEVNQGTTFIIRIPVISEKEK